MEAVIVKRIILGVLVACTVIAGQAFAGGFSQSCEEMHLDHSTLKAKCYKANEKVLGKTTSIDLDDYIGNTHGTLVWNGKNFDKHCENKQLIQAGWSQMLLRATCKNAIGVHVSTQINLDERISNIDGHLKYDQ